ncbi:MAG TPA: DNA repair protein RadC [Vicinamibacterales bacterium]|jgi:DNA repair protein RadC|nr:DNA repair protein RadC [Vicinamibacterales bacterium]
MIDDIAAHDRPREKLDRNGAGALGDNELVALVIGHGTAGRSALAVANAILAAAGGVRGLTRTPRAHLARVPGVGVAQASRVQAAVELGRRTMLPEGSERPQFRDPMDLAAYLLPLYGAHPVERFGALLLDKRNRLIATRLWTVGSVDTSPAHPRDVLREALIDGATGVVVFHNHPSGDPRPSPPDVALTARLKAAGHIVGVELLDHVVLADDRYCSMKEMGCL